MIQLFSFNFCIVNPFSTQCNEYIALLASRYLRIEADLIAQQTGMESDVD